MLVTEVLYLKPGESKNFCIVDAAMNDLMRPAMYEAWMRDRRRASAARRARRSLWTSSARSASRATGSAATARWRCAPGDFVAVLSAGAYAHEHGQQLQHPRPRAAEVLVSGDQAWLIRDRETAADLFRGEHLLPDAEHRRAAEPQIRPSSTAWQATRDAAERQQHRPLDPAALVGMRAARVERAARAADASGFGTSPCTGVRARPLMWMSGIASSSMRVYGWRGAANSSALSASSTRRPRYITPTWSLTWRTTARLCEMKR